MLYVKYVQHHTDPSCGLATFKTQDKHFMKRTYFDSMLLGSRVSEVCAGC